MAALAWAGLALACTRGTPPPAAVPAWHGQDADGEPVALGTPEGARPLVLEWWNPLCPYVRQHYAEGAVQRLQADWHRAGRAWWWVLSLPPGVPAPDAQALAAQMARVGAQVGRVVVDPSGELARALGVAVTPTVVVVDRWGRRAYRGGIDDRRRVVPATGTVAIPTLARALGAVARGAGVALTDPPQVGCALRLGGGV